MFCVIRPSYSSQRRTDLTFSLTRLNLVAFGTFSGDGRERWMDNDGYVTRDL